MNWSMQSVSYRMSGSGSWQNLLTDEQARRLYAEIYPDGLPAVQAKEKLHHYLDTWNKAHIIRMEGRQVIPTGPVMTGHDLEILSDWFKAMATVMSDAVVEKIPEYRRIALHLAGSRSSEWPYVNNILTILICALTLDSQVFSLLRKEVMGTYPDREFAGTFFFWGYGFSGGPSRIFGFTSYGSWLGPPIHVLRSHGLDREVIKSALRRRNAVELIQQLALERGQRAPALADETPNPSEISGIIAELRQAGILEGDVPVQLGIPVFSAQAMAAAGSLFQWVSEKIKQKFLSRMNDLDDLIKKCSFQRCTKADIYCMLFHLAYSFAADKLVENGTIPDFPQSAGGEWGVWIH